MQAQHHLDSLTITVLQRTKPFLAFCALGVYGSSKGACGLLWHWSVEAPTYPLG